METENISKEILDRLVKLQSDIEYIKVKVESNGELQLEMSDWENASAEDSSDFFEENSL